MPRQTDVPDQGRIWITGAGGLIGHALARSAPFSNVAGLTHDQLELTDHAALARLARREKPAVVIHCAAVSGNTVCDADPALAREINVGGTRSLLESCADCFFVFFSTDLVFDGEKGGYVEEDPPNPLSVYAETKVEAEAIVRAYARHCIVRVSLTGGHSLSGGRGFNEEMKNAWRNGKTLTLFTDEYRCPCAAEVIARATWELVQANATGTYHLCGSEKLSRFTIGRLLAARHPELNPKIVPSSRLDFKGPRRPADTSMNCSKAAKLLSFSLPRFSKWLEEDQTGF